MHLRTISVSVVAHTSRVQEMIERVQYQLFRSNSFHKCNEYAHDLGQAASEFTS
jgi:hypothetical protein